MGAKKGMIQNPSGKGGFQEHPELIRKDKWNGRDNFKICCARFKRMTVDEFGAWSKEFTAEKRTIAEDMAFTSVLNARTDLAHLKYVIDMTEGKAHQSIDVKHSGGIDTSLREMSTEELLAKIDDLKG